MAIRYSLRSILIVISIVAMFCFALRWCFGPVVSPVVLRRLKRGMTPDEVVEVLGEPFDRKESEWLYERLFNPGWLTVKFDDAGRYGGYSEERAFP